MSTRVILVVATPASPLRWEAKITFHEVGYVSARPATPQRESGDSMSDTVLNSASRMGRVLPAPRATTPGKREPIAPMAPAPEPAAPLAFKRPPARPMPVAESSGSGNAEHREGLLRRFLHK